MSAPLPSELQDRRCEADHYLSQSDLVAGGCDGGGDHRQDCPCEDEALTRRLHFLVHVLDLLQFKRSFARGGKGAVKGVEGV